MPPSEPDYKPGNKEPQGNYNDKKHPINNHL